MRFGIFGYFGKLFWLCCNGVLNFFFFKFGCMNIFGVGLQIWEEVDDIYPRFLHWLPKYRLSTPSKRSLEIWHMVINNLTIDDVSLFFFF